MNELPELFPVVLPNHELQTLYLEVCRQIAKDFNPHAVMQMPDGNISPTMILEEIKRMLEVILQQGGSQLGAVIYRVDLKESNTRKTMAENNPAERIEALSFLILKREAQKVWLRKHLGQNSNP